MIEKEWKIIYAPDAKKDLKKLPSVNLAVRKKYFDSIEEIAINPYTENSKTLSGDYRDCLAIKLNDQHRLVYEVHCIEKIVKILSILGHYND